MSREALPRLNLLPIAVNLEKLHQKVLDCLLQLIDTFFGIYTHRNNDLMEMV